MQNIRKDYGLVKQMVKGRHVPLTYVVSALLSIPNHVINKELYSSIERLFHNVNLKEKEIGKS